MDAEKAYRFDIEGQEVVCYQTGEDRLWVCKCDYFEQTLKQHKEGFCPHTAAAIMRAMREGTIEFNFGAPKEAKKATRAAEVTEAEA